MNGLEDKIVWVPRGYISKTKIKNDDIQMVSFDLIQQTVKPYLLNHEEDIATDFEDFGALEELFYIIFNRKPNGYLRKELIK